MTSPAIELSHISKAFGSVQALRDVSFDCNAGEVHALVGENGAGKSTLIKILAGVYRPDAGEVRLNGESRRFAHPVDALRAGISIIYQEFALLPERTVAQNVMLGREPTRRGFIDVAAMRAEATRVLDLFNVHIDPDTPVSALDVASQQTVEIAKAIALDAKVVVMDEPTAALNEEECELLFERIDRIRARGTAVVYITHRMREVTRLADRVTVLKDGEVAARFQVAPEPEAVVRAMVGRDIAEFYPPPAALGEVGDVVLSVRGLRNERLRDVSFDLRAGEIVGFAGLQGAGRETLAMALYGAAPVTAGTVALAGEGVRFASPRDAIRAGIGLLPGDRKAEALVLMQSVRDNGLLAARAFGRLWASARTNPYAGPEAMDGLLDRMAVRAGSYGQRISTLSGGNQQKAIVARWLAMKPKVLIFVEPTRGIDVNAKAGIYHLMRDLSRAGTAIMMVSSDLPEVIGVADRIVVMRAGTVAAEFPRGAGEHDIMMAAALEHAA